jgi:hypothetical protein
MQMNLWLIALTENRPKPQDLVTLFQLPPNRYRRHFFPLGSDHEAATLHATDELKRPGTKIFLYRKIDQPANDIVTILKTNNKNPANLTSLIFHRNYPLSLC